MPEGRVKRTAGKYSCRVAVLLLLSSPVFADGQQHYAPIPVLGFTYNTVIGNGYYVGNVSAFNWNNLFEGSYFEYCHGEYGDILNIGTASGINGVSRLSYGLSWLADRHTAPARNYLGWQASLNFMAARLSAGVYMGLQNASGATQIVLSYGLGL